MGLLSGVRGSLSAVLIGVALRARAVGAAELPACTLEITSELPAESPWLEDVSELERRIAGMQNIDRCARLLIRATPSGVSVQVTTADGRAAVREVSQPQAFVRSVEALLVLPPKPPTTAAAQRSPPATPEVAPHVRVDHARSARLELGAGLSGRLSGGPLYGGIGATGLAHVRLESWLFGIVARWDADQMLKRELRNFSMESGSLAFLVGHRSNLGIAALDVLVGPNIVLENQELEGTSPEVSGDGTDLRLDTMLRVSFPRRAPARMFVAADFELSPSRLRHRKYLHADLPSAPSWSTGLAAGVLWDAL